MHNGNEYHNSNGKFRNGNPGKPHGSSRNKMRDKIKNFINEQWENLPKWFNELTPKEKINAMLELMPYCIGRLSSINLVEYPEAEQPREMNLDALTDAELRTLTQLQNKLFKNDKDSITDLG